MITGEALEGLIVARVKLTITEFATVLGYGHRTGYQWLTRGVSKAAAVRAENVFDGAIQAHELRPDIFVNPDLYDPSPEVRAAIRARLGRFLEEEAGA